MGSRGPKGRVSQGDLLFYATEIYKEFRQWVNGFESVRLNEEAYLQWAATNDGIEELTQGAVRGVYDEEPSGPPPIGNPMEQFIITEQVPGEPELLEKLLHANTPRDVHSICEDPASILRHVGIRLFSALLKHPEQFLKAKSDLRYPGDPKRPTNRPKQLWFLSRALAGAEFGLSVRTSIDLLNSRRPDQLITSSPNRQKRNR